MSSAIILALLVVGLALALPRIRAPHGVAGFSLGSLFSSTGGSSSSSSSTTTTNIDKRIVQGDGGFAIAPDQATVNFLEPGAIDKALEFAQSTEAGQVQTLSDVLGFARDAFKSAAQSTTAAGAVVASAYDNAQGQGDQKTYVMWAALGVVALVGFQAFIALRKK